MNLTARITRALGSRRFLYGVLLFFGLEGVWVALSAAYPMAFDEEFHIGVIRMYTHQWLPFLAGQPDNAGQFGALAADPSYLYHYAMSFPYRLLQWLGLGQMGIVIVLRLINVALAVAAVYLFARVLHRAGMSAAFTNVAAAIFVLVPAVPLLAGQVNYDNAMLLLLAWMCLLAFDVHAALLKRQVAVRALLLCAAACMLASLVKYAVLPFAAGIVLFLLGSAILAFRGQWRALLPSLTAGWRAVSHATQAATVVIVLVSAVLFVQRYGLNTVRYHTPVPSCDAVLSIHECLAYGPWARNYGLSKIVPEDANTSALAYTYTWAQALHYRLFFAVNGPSDSYRNYPPLPAPSATFVLLTITGILALLCYGWCALRNRPLLLCLLGMCVLYIGVLWAEDYSQYVETGQPVAINGRYLIPMLFPMAAVCGAALREALRPFRNAAWIKVVATVAIVLLFINGGGVFTFITRSDTLWYWPEGPARALNETAQRILLPVIFEGNKYYQ